MAYSIYMDALTYYMAVGAAEFFHAGQTKASFAHKILIITCQISDRHSRSLTYYRGAFAAAATA